MVQLIIGEKGKGKTKVLLDKANDEVLKVSGNVVYLDNSSKHMYELNNKVRLIDVSSCDVNNSDEFVGFLNGIISQDHDLELMFFDNFLSIACIKDSIEDVLNRIDSISKRTNVNFVISMSKVESEIPDSFKESIIAAL